jgi:hypothetical protein
VVLFSSPPDGSEAHYLLDGPLALFPTLDSLGLLDNFGELRENGTDLSQVPTQSPQAVVNARLQDRLPPARCK